MARRVDRDHQALTADLDQDDQTTCEQAEDRFAKNCRGDWQYLGNGKCCTSKWVACAYYVSNDFYCDKPFVFLGRGQCCLASDSAVRLTENFAEVQFCTGDWTVVGLSTCATTKRAVKCLRGEKDRCKAPWHYIGLSQCCLTSDSELQLTEAKGTRRHCSGNWTYLGYGNCVTTKPATKCVRGDKAHCKAPWSYIGFEQCCLTSDVEFHLTDVKGSSEYCKGDWTYLGHGTCVSTKQAAKCVHGGQDDCKAPWSYVGNDQCCWTAEDSMAKMHSISVVVMAISSFGFLWR
eukprot:Skav215057  [mRNA]  locus=scaffold1021:294877:295746:- [translate_table: standard]